MKLADSTRISR